MKRAPKQLAYIHDKKDKPVWNLFFSMAQADVQQIYIQAFDL